MEFLYKEDWDKAEERIMAYWEREIVDRVCIQVTAPLKEINNTPPGNIEDYWTNIEQCIERAHNMIKSTFWGGEAFPIYYHNLGPDVFASYLGTELCFLDTNTSWSRPIIRECKDITNIKFGENNKWWVLTKNLTQRAVEVGEGKFFVGLTDIHGGMDALAALRGPENLCLDLVYYKL